MKTLVIGDTSEELYKKVSSKYGNACLINEDNFSLEIEQGCYFTALGDLSFDKIKALALSVDKVEYVKDLPWNDSNEKELCQILCSHLNNFVTVENFSIENKQTFLEIDVKRKYSDATLWTFGCSHTVGDGLDNPEQQVYGKLVADALNMPWQNIAIVGTSSQWLLDHLVHCDLRPNDVVVLGFTSAERFRRASSFQQCENVMLTDAEKHEVLFFTDEQLYFDYIDKIYKATQYLENKNIQFVFCTFLKLSPIMFKIEKEASKYPQWCPVKEWYNFDLGNDGIHIGPLGHRYLADKILDHLELVKGLSA